MILQKYWKGLGHLSFHGAEHLQTSLDLEEIQCPDSDSVGDVSALTSPTKTEKSGLYNQQLLWSPPSKGSGVFQNMEV